MVYHHGWANSRGDCKEAECHEKQVMEIDQKLQALAKRYEDVKAGNISELQQVEVVENVKDK